MIDVKKTIYATIVEKINNLRFLGQTNPIGFKKLLYLVILDDVYDWSNYLDDKQSIQKLLQQIRNDFILYNKDFLIKYKNKNNLDESVIEAMLPYTNVNTPLTNNTWRRIWDSADVVEMTSLISPSETIMKPFKPDCSCKSQLILYPTDLYGGIERNSNGEPFIPNFNNLTTCEKMNIFVDRETGTMYYIDPNDCSWKTVKSTQEISNIDWSHIDNPPTIYSGIKHLIIGSGSDTQFNVELQPSTYDPSTKTWSVVEHKSDASATDCDPDPNSNTDLNDIL